MLLDLVSLALGAPGDHAYVARERGMAAAWLPASYSLDVDLPIQAFRQQAWHAGSA